MTGLPGDAGGNGGERRRRALGHGRFAETLAALALRLKGYRIIARNFRTRSGEIDIIARRGDLVAIVEVKARDGVAAAVDAVGHHSRERIRRAAGLWLARQKDAPQLSLRFDIVAVLPRRWPVHLPDAF